MSDINGSLLVGIIEKYASSAADNNFTGAVLGSTVTIGNAPPVYKNQGWYAAGSVYEQWISTPLPSTFPPSAHTLADIQHVVLSQ